jgi:pimeloyl-ACP methyl ester carboxylesterase
MYITAMVLFFFSVSIAIVYYLETTELKIAPDDEPSTGRKVILVHGILRGSSSMNKIKYGLVSHGFRVTGFDYTTKDGTIEEISDRLHERIKKSRGKINFVTHSLGAVIVRYYISKYKPENIGRVVMIAPPNNGSSYAATLSRIPIYKKIFGSSGMEIAGGKNCIVNRLPVPDFEFGIIAGGTGSETGWNPFLKGDNDGTVLVEETIIKGMADFILIKGQHSLLLLDKNVVSESIYFLKKGKFKKKS